MLGVWAAWSTGAAGARWRPLLRLALVFGAVSVLFNLLTAHIGDRGIGALPESWPVIGGPLTLNALIYGLLSAMAIFSLVAVSATLGATLDWSATMRLLPERMAALAVAGSVAWSYLPRTTAALPKSGRRRWRAVIARAVSATPRLSSYRSSPAGWSGR